MKESDILYTFSENIEKEKYDAFVKEYSMAPFYQEYNWSNVKEGWNSFHCGLFKDDKLVGVCLVLSKKIIGKIKMFYIPRGYLIDFTNFDDLKEMTNGIKKLAKKYKAYMVKIDPNFCISDDSMKDEECEHNYSNNYQEKHQNLLKLGYKWTGMHKSIKDNLQPQYNMFAPLCDINSNIVDDKTVLSSYKSKVRYYIGAFHEKRGITFEITNDINKVSEFVSILKDTEKKQNINLRNEEYFKSILKNYEKNAYLAFARIDLNKYLDFLNENNGKEEDINEVKELLKENNSITLSTALLLLPSNEKGIRTSEYLYAGNSQYLTNVNASLGIVFELLKFSIENNCHYCNLGGVDGNLNDHLSIFKKKFNAHLMVFAGEYDLATSFIYYPIKLFYPILLKVYRKIKKGKQKTED